MEWSTDWLYMLLLNRARETFQEALSAASRRSEDPPKILFATEHKEWGGEVNMTRGDPIRIWSSEDDFKSLVEAEAWNKAKLCEPATGSILRVPQFSFYITKDRKQVLICRWIGPRYGDGGWWDIVGRDSSGELVRADRPMWIS